jgi:hypothetical protein
MGHRGGGCVVIAHLVRNIDPGRPQRLVMVDDPALPEFVTVWWSLERPRPWRCSEHGRTAGPACDHARAAAVLLARQLFLVGGTDDG